MNGGRTVLTVLLASALALAACGLKGDPVRPEPEKEKTTQQKSGS